MDPFEMGFYGMILGLLGVIPWVGPILLIAGFVLISLAFYKISKEKGKPEIWKNYLKFFTMMLVGGIIAAIFGELALIKLSETQDIFISLLQAIPMLIIGYLPIVIGMYFYKKAWEGIAEVSGVNLFRTAGFLYFLGAILLIVVVGAVLNIIAAVLSIVAFYKAKSKKV